MQTMRIIDCKTSGYFSGYFRIVSVVLMLAGILILAVSILTGIVLLLISATMFTTHYRLRIDPANKTYHDYVWIWGIKSGEKGRFETIEYIFIKKSRISQTMNSRVTSSTIRKEVFDAYLKFSGDSKIHLITLDSKKDIMARANEIASKVNVKLVDYTAVH